MSNCADWHYPGEFLTIPIDHEIEYCRSEFETGFLNAFHNSRGVRIVRFVPNEIAIIVLMADPGNGHDLFVIHTDAIHYEKYLQDQVELLKNNPGDLDEDNFRNRIIQLAEEHVFAKKLKDDYMSQVIAGS